MRLLGLAIVLQGSLARDRRCRSRRLAAGGHPARAESPAGVLPRGRCRSIRESIVRLGVWNPDRGDPRATSKLSRSTSRQRLAGDLELVISETRPDGRLVGRTHTEQPGRWTQSLKVQLNPGAEASRLKNAWPCCETGSPTDRRVREVAPPRHIVSKVASKELPDGVAAVLSRAITEFAFDSGGMIRSAMNEGKSTPINVKITGQESDEGEGSSPRRLLADVRGIDGVVDARIIQRLNYPLYMIEVDRSKAASIWA